jgi:hypothetical protein
MKIYHFLILTLFSISLTIVSCKDNKGETTTEGQTVDSLGGIIPVADPAADPAMGGTPVTVGGAGSEPHYKCTKEGCSGSGAAAGKCPVCGTELVHNQAFHAQAAAAGAAGSSPANPVQVTQSGGTPTTATPTTTPTPPSAKNAKGEYHYKCSKGHAGAASAGNCSTCGEPLTHNQAYHAN